MPRPHDRQEAARVLEATRATFASEFAGQPADRLDLARLDQLIRSVEGVVAPLERMLKPLPVAERELESEGQLLLRRMRKARDVVARYKARPPPSEHDLFVAEPVTRLGIWLRMRDRAAREGRLDVALALEVRSGVERASADLRTRTPAQRTAWMVANLNAVPSALEAAESWASEVAANASADRDAARACLRDEWDLELLTDFRCSRASRFAFLQEVALDLEVLDVASQISIRHREQVVWLQNAPLNTVLDLLEQEAAALRRAFGEHFEGRALTPVDAPPVGRLADRASSLVLLTQSLRYPPTGPIALGARFDGLRRKLLDLLSNLETNERHAVHDEHRTATGLRDSGS